MNPYTSSYPYGHDAGASSSRRPSGYDDLAQPQLAYLSPDNRNSAGRFDDASEDERAPSFDLSSAMSSFDPPPPRDAYVSSPPSNGYTGNESLSTSISALSLSAERRLPPSHSGTLRGNRAPAPAALDLSPRSERVRQEAERRPEQIQPRRVSRPLPVPPNVPARSDERPIYPHTSSVPLSAVGPGGMQQRVLDPPSLAPATLQSPRIPKSASFSPGSPEFIDPATLDRNNLIGVGELSTPRWAASTSQGQRGSTPPVPNRDWAQGRTGLGLGVGVDQDETPKRLRPDKGDPLLALNHLTDFDFDSTMTAALAASLSVPDEPPSPPRANREHRASAPAQSQHFDTSFEPSPNTARARIYARRQSRQIQDQPPPPPRTSSKQTPPNSADPYRNSRRTPPQTTPKSRQSPGASHHDIIKHFAPKDFSHLPPSPSSASINQFLRGSGSVSNFAAMGPGTPPAGTSYFPASTSAKSIQRSSSIKGSSGWEGKEVNPDTAEALRKLDGLSTPGKRTPKKAPTSSRPGTPPPNRGKLGASSSEKLKPASAHGSPLINWVDLAEEMPAVPPGRLGKADATGKRESSSSTSVIGTPTSRDSHSVPTASTTPLSSSGNKAARRASAGSDVSGHSDLIDTAEVNVPPVPPIPKSFSTIRSHDSPEVQSPTSVPSESSQTRPPQMSKKWSFSSALNLRLNKESSSSPASSPGVPEEAKSPQPSWTELSSPDDSARTSTTPIASGLPAPMPKPGQAKRLTPSSIPFFRRTSSSSIPRAESSSMPPPPATTRNVSGGTVRKSVMGMASMLRGNSKRHVSAQALPEEPIVDIRAEPQYASTGWTGRKRGKTLSISGDLPGRPVIPVSQTLRSKPSVDSQYSSAQSSRSGSTVHAGLPAIVGSPALRQPNSTSSLRESPRNPPSATPTKIPRIARPTESPARGSMPPPTLPASTGSRNGMPSRTTSASISEFGSMNGVQSTPKQLTSGNHRAHLLAPMSARADTRRPEKSTDPLVRQVSGQVVPPSRRHLPMAQSITAPTASSIAKRSSREFRSGARVGTSSGQQTPSDNASPIKPSKSLHAKLALAPPSRLPSSSSVGASSFRKTSLVPDSPSVSPAEDDETQADLEMVAYVKRRQARHASGKKEDLFDISRFPEDIPPSTPMTQREYISKHLSSLTDFQRKEILDFDRIYYTPANPVKRPASGAIYNHGYDDERGDYIVVEGDHLCYRYEVTGTLGKGSFGQVVGCRDHKTGGSAAIKIIRNKKRFHAQALVEVKILQQLVEWDPEDRHYMVRMTDHFYFRGHLCIVTEMLSINLYELIKANQFAGFSTIVIRRFTSQMLSALQLMRSHRIVHCDLKPENILLTHPSKSGIKVIDFGSSCLETEKVYTYIQSRFYRSPEVILGMNYAMAIDMWSLGCILAELYTGVPIFPGENEHEQLACIMEVLGVPDRYIVDRSSRKKLFFDATGAPRPFVNGKGKRRRPGAKTLAAVLKSNDEQFIDFISRCLTWDPDKRLKPQPALRHPWIVAGRRRQAPAAPSSTLRARVDPAKAEIKGKSSLVISPPTSLQARPGQVTVPGSAQRFGHASKESTSSTMRAGQYRPSAFASPQKASLG